MTERDTTLISAALPRRLSLGDCAHFFSKIDLGIVLILILPWALLSVGVNWVTQYVFGHGWLDDWFYVGFFLDLRNHFQHFPGTYYGSRLSWILPGHVAFKLLPPQIAAYTLHFGVYYAAILSLYITLKYMVGRRAALVTATLMGGYCFFLWAVGWDYVDGAGIMYFLLTTLALTLSIKGKYPLGWLSLAGAFYGAMIYSQLFLLVLTPPILLYYFLANRSSRRFSLLLSAFTFTFGFLAISLILGLVNYKLGGAFLFYTPSVREALYLTKVANPWRRPFQVWWKEATWLVIPGAILLSSFFSLWKFRSHRAWWPPVLFQSYYLACALILVLFELKGMPVLQYLYYASFLIPGVFLAIGGQIGLGIDRVSSGVFVFVLGEATLMPLLAYRVLRSFRLVLWLHSHLLFLFLSFGFLGIVFLFLREHPVKTLALCSSLCLVVALVNISSEGFRVIDPDSARYGWAVIRQSVEAIRTIEPNGNMLFWYQADEPMVNFYRAVASIYLWGYTLLNEQFPALEGANNYRTLTTKNQIVILSTGTAAFQKADAALRRIGFTAELVAERRIQGGPIGWNMIFVALELASSPSGARLNQSPIENANFTLNGRAALNMWLGWCGDEDGIYHLLPYVEVQSGADSLVQIPTWAKSKVTSHRFSKPNLFTFYTSSLTSPLRNSPSSVGDPLYNTRLSQATRMATLPKWDPNHH